MPIVLRLKQSTVHLRTHQNIYIRDTTLRACSQLYSAKTLILSLGAQLLRTLNAANHKPREGKDNGTDTLELEKGRARCLLAHWRLRHRRLHDLDSTNYIKGKKEKKRQEKVTLRKEIKMVSISCCFYYRCCTGYEQQP